MEVTKTKLTSLKYFSILVALIINILIFCVIGLTGKFVYYINDDRCIADSISGKYLTHSTNYGVFVSQIICYPLKLLYNINVSIPFYGIFMLLTLFFSLTVVGTYLIKTTCIKKLITTSLVYIFLSLSLFYYHVMNMQFTLTAIFPALASLCVINCNKELKIKHYVLIFFLFLLSFSIRENVFLLCLPFVGFSLLFKLIKNKQQLKTTFIIVSLVIVSILMSKGVDFLVFKNDTEYKYYLEYTEVRSDLFDIYGIPSYSEAPDLYDRLDMSEESVDLFKYHYLIDIEECSLENLKEILAYQKANMNLKDKFIKNIRSVYFTYKRNFREVLFLILIVIVNLTLLKNKKEGFLIALFLLGMTGGLSFIVSFLMKFPSRIASCFILVTTMTFITISADKEYIKINTNILANTIIAIVFIALSICSMRQAYLINPVIISNLDGRDIVEEIVTQDNENIYLIDNNIVTVYNDYVFAKTKRINNLLLSTWQSHSPIVKEQLNNLGYNSLNEMFKNANNLKIISNGSDIEPFKKYLKNKYNRDLESVPDQNGYGIYLVV